MKWIGMLALAFAAPLLFAGCRGAGGDGPRPTAEPGGASSRTETAYHKISAEDAREMIDAGGVTIVDVRREDEYTQEHIPGAVLVPLGTIGDQPPEALPEKDAVLLVYCRSGVRSRQAAQKLEALGYQNIYDFGGIIDWPYETESGTAE